MRWLGPLLKLPTPVIFVAAACIATWLIWRQGALADVGASLAAVPPWKLVVILVVYGGSILLLGVRWHTLVRLAGGAPAWPASAEVFLTSVIVNYAAPIGLAVPTRAALTVRDLGLGRMQSGVVVGWELGLDVLALLAISLAWIATGGMTLVQRVTLNLGMFATAAVLFTLAIGALILSSRSKPARARMMSVLRPMYAEPLQRPTTALVAVALTAMYWIVQLAVMRALIELLGVTSTPALVFGLMGPPMLIGMLSPVPGGAGVREALMATMAQFEGVPSAPVILAAVAYRLALFVVTPIVWGALRLARRRFSL
jgi:uncharacterized membrane protein YbhN (UPF0104 family)